MRLSGDRRAIHMLEWIARAISFLALTTIAMRDALLCGEQTVELTAVVIVVAFAYLLLAFRLRMGQLAPAEPVSQPPSAHPGHPYRGHRPGR